MGQDGQDFAVYRIDLVRFSMGMALVFGSLVSIFTIHVDGKWMLYGVFYRDILDCQEENHPNTIRVDGERIEFPVW